MTVSGDKDIEIPNEGWNRIGRKYISRLFSFEDMKQIASSRMMKFKVSLAKDSGGVATSIIGSGNAAINYLFQKCGL
jgi:hypothetical protein